MVNVRKTGQSCPCELTGKERPQTSQKCRRKRESKPEKRPCPGECDPGSRAKNNPFLNHPLWLVASSTSRSSESQEVHTEILCKRISWIVAETIARQLVSVVSTSI